jgi:opacity protein-like surface antigen
MKRLILGLFIVFFPGIASAQDANAIVTTTAPIYLMPDTTRTPLRMAAVNTRLRVINEQHDWVQVEFQDPQFGRRIGYIQAGFVDIVRSEMRPMDLSVPDAPSPVSATRPMPQASPRVDFNQPIAKQRRYRGYALGIGGLTFQSETSGLFGGEFGGNVTADLQIYGQVGRMINALPKSFQEDVDNAASLLTYLTGDRWKFDAKLPATYFGGGVKYLVPTGTAVRPFAIGGVNGGSFKASVNEIDLGEVVDDLVDYGYLDEDDVKATKFGFEVGGGLMIPVGAMQFEAGYRFMKFVDTEIEVSRFVVGFGTRF